MSTCTGTLAPPLTAVTTGGAHTIVAAPDGRLYVWGNNGNGQLGKGNTAVQTTPIVLNTIAGVTAVSGGLAHTLALRWDGQLYAFGSNVNGRLGDGTTDQKTSPVHVATLSNVIAIAAGDAHNLALRSDGHVFVWGANASGQLGLGDSGSGTDRLVPTEIPSLSNIVAIAAGDSHSFAVTAGGQLYAWGANGNARLGIGTTPSVQNTPALVPLSNVAAIAAGQAHTLAMTGAGRVYGWGANSNGQVGVAPTTTVSTPTLIANLHVSAIAAGDNHSAAIRADGALLLWGNSGSGQVGNNSTTTTLSVPTVISGPSTVSTINLGDLHSVAITSAGEAWTWGESSDGRLGNGSTTPDRLTPQSVLTGLTDWRPATPTINVPSGILGGAQMVTMTASTSGSVIRYTQNGTTPTEADAEVPANGQVEIAYSSLLRARAFVSGRQPSAIGRSEYELQSAPPVISPSTGTYSSAQTVTITQTGVPGNIRYTLNGTEPTETSTLYSGPFSLSTAMTVKAKIFPSNGWSASSAANATLTFNYGTLSPPSASPAAGVYADAQLITLSAAPGAAIRYTLDGSEPTAVSNQYVAPLPVGSGTVTIKARVFHTDWTQSPVASHGYTIDAAAPTIISSRFPAVVAGWHNAPTRVSFACEDNVGVASCSSPTTVSSEGAGQQIVGIAVDQIGRQAIETVTLNLDSTAPTVIITSPSGSLTTSSLSINLTGEVSDALSGITGATCNGQDAAVVSGVVSCTVPLGPGRNDVMLAARDAAGNVTSKSVRIVRTGIATALELTPTARTLLVDETTTLALTDEFGTIVTEATWSTSDPEIVSVSGDDPPVLTALQAGNVVITVAKSGLSATAELTVVAGTTLPHGTTRWSMSAAGVTVAMGMVSNRLDLSVPDLFSVETSGTTTVVRGVMADGETAWLASAPGEPIMADAFGGLIAGTNGASDHLYGDYFSSLIRFGGPHGSPGWRYDSPGTVNRPAQAPDGTIYTIERYPTGLNNPNGSAIHDTQILVIDGTTGGVRSRYPLARERRGGIHCGTEVPPATLHPVVGTDGYGYVLVRRNLCSDTNSQDVGIDLLAVSPSGTVSTTSIYSQQCASSSPTICDQAPLLEEVFPDGIGGTLVRAFIYTSATAQGYSGEMRIARVVDGAVQFNNAVDADERITMIGDAGTAFVGGDDVRAVDVTNWTTKWVNSNTSLEPVAALPNGGAAMHDLDSGQLIAFNAAGAQGESATFGGRWGYQSSLGNWISVDASNRLSARRSLSLTEASTSFTYLGGLGDRQNAPRFPTFVQFIEPDMLAMFGPEGPYRPRHYQDEFNVDIRNRQILGSGTFFNVENAEANRFLSEAEKQVDALAFVGHSVSVPARPEWRSVGLLFYGSMSIVKQMSPEEQPYGPGGLAFTIVVPTIRSAAKVVFIAACDTGPIFESVWGLGASGRALILPVNEQTDLYWAAQAWRIMARSLSQPNTTVGAAVAAGNAFLATEDRTLRFKVVGDSNVRLR